MPTITLKEGDFGSEGVARFDLADLYLPDTAHPGATMLFPLSQVVEVESLRSDNTGRLQAAAKLSGKGFLTAGPVGLAAGLLAARRVPDVVFKVSLSDGRAFVASADAATFAELHAAQLAACADAGGMRTPADDIVEKYIQAQAEEEAAPTPPQSSPSTPAAPAATVSGPPKTDRPVFGKRRR
jgi:hypothetical protein